MKIVFSILIFLFFCFPGSGQNLITNGSFEDYVNYENSTDCSTKSCIGWELSVSIYVPKSTDHFRVNYYNKDADDIFGLVKPLKGNCCAGFTIREHLVNKLQSPLKKDSLYEFSFYYRLNPKSDYYARWFSVRFIDQDTLSTFSSSPPEYEGSRRSKIEVETAKSAVNIPCDSCNSKAWKKFRYIYKAKGGEAGLMFGLEQHITKDGKGFCSVLFPDSVNRNPKAGFTYKQLYYYIDEVSLIPYRAPVETGRKTAVYNILFDVGKSEIKAESYPYLNELAEYLLLEKHLKIKISGHTDNSGSAEGNRKLSLARAVSVGNYLVSRGIARERISTAGYGSEQAVSSNASAQGRALNRRIEIEITEP